MTLVALEAENAADHPRCSHTSQEAVEASGAKGGGV